ncbi:hypothetical protein FC831_19350, partial [Clostridium botulinum]|nr:hypothetical protein [Clostridium botulinum]
IGIGKLLIQSPAFPLLHTVRVTFITYGVPSILITYIIHNFQLIYEVYLVLLSLFYQYIS